MQSESLAQIYVRHFGAFNRLFLAFSKNKGIAK